MLAPRYTLLALPPEEDFFIDFSFLLGVSVTQSIHRIKSPEKLFSFRRPSPDRDSELLQLYASDQYRNFDLLEHALCQPELLAQQSLIVFPRDRFPLLVDRYYALDDAVAREIICKQRLTKTRKDLDEIATATGSHLKSVTRQFDNLKRIFIATEDCPGNVYRFLIERYMLSSDLAKKYCCLVFLVSNGFALGSKKRILRVPCLGLERCAAVTMVCLVTDLNLFSSSCPGEDSVDELLPLGASNELTWSSIWRCIRSVPNAEGIDKQLQQDLSRVRVLCSQQSRYEPGLNKIRVMMGPNAVFLPPVARDVLRDLVMSFQRSALSGYHINARSGSGLSCPRHANTEISMRTCLQGLESL